MFVQGVKLISAALRPMFRVFHKIINRNILPKSGSTNTVNGYQNFLMMCLEERKKVNLPSLIMSNLIISVLNTKDTRPKLTHPGIPYPITLSNILIRQGVLLRIRKERPNSYISYCGKKARCHPTCFGGNNLVRMRLVTKEYMNSILRARVVVKRKLRKFPLLPQLQSPFLLFLRKGKLQK